MTEFRRQVLTPVDTDQVGGLLQKRLVELIDLALQLKQAHWSVVGPNFRSVHIQLDEIIDDIRVASDDVAERLATIGLVPDGLAGTVSTTSTLSQTPVAFMSTSKITTATADLLQSVILGLRGSISRLGGAGSDQRGPANWNYRYVGKAPLDGAIARALIERS